MSRDEKRDRQGTRGVASDDAAARAESERHVARAFHTEAPPFFVAIREIPGKAARLGDGVEASRGRGIFRGRRSRSARPPARGCLPGPRCCPSVRGCGCVWLSRSL